MFMKIRRVKHTEAGISIEFISNKVCRPGDIFKIHYHGEKYYFKATIIETLDRECENIILKVIANEIGYWVNKLDNLYASGFELYIGELLNIHIEKVNDEDEKNKILEENCWL